MPEEPTMAIEEIRLPDAAAEEQGDELSLQYRNWDPSRTPPDDEEDRSSHNSLERTDTLFEWRKFKLRRYDDADEQDWWFASTAIPLVAATIGPMANVLSIAALVSTWRESEINPKNPNGPYLPQLMGIDFPDPKWCYDLNATSLVCGFVGNLFLLLNFTNRIPYIIALPVTIILWYVATAILIGIELSMNIYVPPIRPQQTYTQAFWHGVIASALYMVCSMILMVNMLGYFLGHYPQHFNLTESQRTLILQTMMFFLYLAGGAAMFQAIEQAYGSSNWSFSDALYFCDVTILTVGFGDLVLTCDVGRALLFPYAVGGIISLGLVVSSLSKFAGEINRDYVVRARLETQRKHKQEKTTSKANEIAEMQAAQLTNGQLKISAPFDTRRTSRQISEPESVEARNARRSDTPNPMRKRKTKYLSPQARRMRRRSTVLLQREKDRFEAMRAIQRSNDRFKRWSALVVSVTVFALLWCLGALVFYKVEKGAQNMSYFEALYFCWVSLLTIGYGDFAPQSNPGRAFFVVWSLLAVPSMTILVGSMGDTVISSLNEATNVLGDFTILPKYGIWRGFLNKHPWLLGWIETWQAERAAKKRLDQGFPTGPDPDVEAKAAAVPTLDELQQRAEKPANEHELAKRLGQVISSVAKDFRNDASKQYSYEEWAEFTQLIKFTSRKDGSDEDDDDEGEGLIDWDWIGEDSPMMTMQTEPHWVLDRLCESLARYTNRQNKKASETSEAASGIADLSSHGVNVQDHTSNGERDQQDQQDQQE